MHHSSNQPGPYTGPVTQQGKRTPMKALKNQASVRYVKTHSYKYDIDINRYFKTTGSALLMLWAVQSGLAHAEVRQYDGNVSQSQITLPRETSTPSQNQAQNEPQNASAPNHSQTVTTDTTGVSAYVAMVQNLKPKEYKLGSARVFIKADDLSPELIKHLQELNGLEELHSEIYFQDVKPTDLAKLFTDKIKDYPKDMLFNVDFNSILANELHVKGQNVIVYTDPKGKSAEYALNSEYAFRAAIEKIKQGVAQ
jgi:hypothetical protein